MRATLRESKDHEVLIDIEGETTAERVLLTHLKTEHIALLCECHGHNGIAVGLRLFVRNQLRSDLTESARAKVEAELKRKRRGRK